jgi:hypothetical protein
MWVVAGSVSLLCMLVGLGRIVVSAPGDSTLVSMLLIAISFFAVPLWWPAVAGKYDVKQ